MKGRWPAWMKLLAGGAVRRCPKPGNANILSLSPGPSRH